jgi:hypothetical protein
MLFVEGQKRHSRPVRLSYLTAVRGDPAFGFDLRLLRGSTDRMRHGRAGEPTVWFYSRGC